MFHSESYLVKFTFDSFMGDTHVQFYRQFYLIKLSLLVQTLRVDGKTDIMHELINV